VEKPNGEVIRSQARLDALAQDAFADASADSGASNVEVVQSWVDDLRGRVS
jgi:hypothetical protein